MLVIWALLSNIALAQDAETLTWNLSLDGKQVGERTLEIKRQTGDDGLPVRVLVSYTEFETQLAGQPVHYRNRVTGTAGLDPASFHSVVDVSGRPMEVQGRPLETGWRVTLIDRKGSKTWDLAESRVQLSTLDLVDPDTSRHIGTLDEVAVLSAETGDIFSGAVASLGTSTVSIGDVAVEVDGWRYETEQGPLTLEYSPSGYLVQYKTSFMGLPLVGTLAEPPPGTAGVSALQGNDGIKEVEL